jgi:hypothetical protein
MIVVVEELDGRKLRHGVQAEVRIRTALQVEAGESTAVAIKAPGFDRTCGYRWIAAYRGGGVASLRPRSLRAVRANSQGSRGRVSRKSENVRYLDRKSMLSYRGSGSFVISRMKPTTMQLASSILIARFTNHSQPSILNL